MQEGLHRCKQELLSNGNSHWWNVLRCDQSHVP